MRPREIEPRVTFMNIGRDFEGAWNGVAKSTEPDTGRGNFLFGLLACVLLEWACRVCRTDATGQSLQRLSEALWDRNSRYFTELPVHCRIPPPPKRKGETEFELPHIQIRRPPYLLWAIYDLVRNGQAHQYQQIPAHLDGHSYFWIAIKGAELRTSLETASERTADHLAFCEYRDGNIGIRVRADLLFLDIRAAIEQSGLLDSGLRHKYLTRSYEITRRELLASLQAGQHPQFEE